MHKQVMSEPDREKFQMVRHTGRLLASAALALMMAGPPAIAQSARDAVGVVGTRTETAVPLYDGAFDGGSGGVADNLGNHVATMRLDLNNNRILRLADPDLSTSGGYDATNRRYVDAKAAAEADAARDNLGNHTATQNLDMSNRRVVNVATPSASSDAATKGYVDTAANAARDNLGNHRATQNLDMASRRVVNLANPSSGTDAANKTYVDNMAAAARDNLGDHTATTHLDMGNFWVRNVAEPTANHHAATKLYVDTRSDQAANSARDNLGNHRATQTLDMRSNRIVNVTNPSAASDAATKSYVDSAANSARDNLGNHRATQALNMGSNRIVGLAGPSAASDAATKAYVDANGSDNLGNHRATTDLNMSNRRIYGVANPSQPADAANRAYVDSWINTRVPEGRYISTGYGLEGGGNFTENRVFSLASSHHRRNSGSSEPGVMAYAGHSRTGGQFYGGDDNPNGSARLNFQGYLHATRFYSQMYLYFSDRTLKENIETVMGDEGMDTVRALRPVSYRWKESGDEAMGVIAQEIEEVMPMAVSTGEDGLKSVDYVQMIAPMLAAIQQLDARVSALEAAH